MPSDKLFNRRKARKIQTERSLQRRPAIKQPQKAIAIISEGEETEINYLTYLRKTYRLSNVTILPSKYGSAPISVVKHAIEYAENNPTVDIVVCIFDRDEHKSFQQAHDKLSVYQSNPKRKSKAKFLIITSTPCFEIWFLLHHLYTAKAYYKNSKGSAADHLIKDLRKYMPGYEKNSSEHFDKLHKKLEQAMKNAKLLKNENEKTGSSNPATNVHELLEHLININNGVKNEKK